MLQNSGSGSGDGGRICLNMIVKNESSIIIRLLESVVSIIDYYVICDTGSTDNTKELVVNFFSAHNIKGVIIEEPFRNFAYNRSFSLQRAQQILREKSCANYILLMDADMKLMVSDIYQFKNTLLENYNTVEPIDIYYLQQGNITFSTFNARIILNKKDFEYRGYTHEYLTVAAAPQAPAVLAPAVLAPAVLAPAVYGKIPPNICSIYDIGDGGSKTNKFKRDIELLSRGLEEDQSLKDRYLFYLGNSYKDDHQYEKAIEIYKKRIDYVGGWNQEIWYCYYYIGECLRSMGREKESIIYWLEATDIFPNRVENIYEIVKYYRLNGKQKLATYFYELAQEIIKNSQEIITNKTTELLFKKEDIYDYLLDYEYTILAYYVNRHTDARKITMNLLSKNGLQHNALIYQSLLENYKFYVPKIATNIEIYATNLYFAAPNDFQNSTPSICSLTTNIRCVNYKILPDGSYDNSKRPITTKNYLKTEKGYQLLKYSTIEDNEQYAGLEDVRLFVPNSVNKTDVVDTIYYSANRGCRDGKIAVEIGKIALEENPYTYDDKIYVSPEGKNRDVEKNWVLFGRDVINVIYCWSPLTIYELMDEKKTLTGILTEPKISQNVPYFFKDLRGSTNGILINNETPRYFFICHLVVYQERRYYYHIAVEIDAKTLQYIRHSSLFVLEGEKVEYVLGCMLKGENFDNIIQISYSTNDNCSKKAEILYDSLFKGGAA